MRRRDFYARSTPRTQRSGTIPRGQLRRAAPSTGGRNWLAALVVATLAIVVLAAVGGVFPVGTADPPAGETLAPGASGTAAAALPSPGTTPTGSVAPPPSPTATAASTRSPTPTPRPSPSPSPTQAPTRPPTPTPTTRPSPTPAASPRGSAAPTVPASGLIIVEPADGAVVSDRSIIVRGLAPPGATITRDIPFWFDEHTTADAAGRWSFAVELVAGENKLTFRIGDQSPTSETVTVRYEAN